MVIGPNGEKMGLKRIEDALTLANYAGLDLRSRAINGILVPYIEIPYEFDFINSIGVSPSSEKELLEEGVEFLWFSKVKGEKPISVWSSNIPKRY